MRELENFIERAVILTNGENLQVPIKELKKSGPFKVPNSSIQGKTLRKAERRAILEALKESSGKVAGPGGAAERLGLKRSTLRNKMHRLNISKDDY